VCRALHRPVRYRHRAPTDLVFWWGSRSWPGVIVGLLGVGPVLLSCSSACSVQGRHRRTDRCWPSFTGLCAGRSGTEAGGADFTPVGRRNLVSNGSFFPQTINTPSPTLERIRLPFKSYICLLSPPLKSIQSFRISHSTHSNPNPFGRKIEETPIYVSTKPNFIPPCVHRVLLVTLGFVGNPRWLGSPGGIRFVIHPVESL
jgi:hypothetical protein